MGGTNTVDLLTSFEKDFREYLESSIAYSEVQEPYKPLSSEDEIKWIKEWWKNKLSNLDEEIQRLLEVEWMYNGLTK